MTARRWYHTRKRRKDAVNQYLWGEKLFHRLFTKHPKRPKKQKHLNSFEKCVTKTKSISDSQARNPCENRKKYYCKAKYNCKTKTIFSDYFYTERTKKLLQQQISSCSAAKLFCCLVYLQGECLLRGGSTIVKGLQIGIRLFNDFLALSLMYYWCIITTHLNWKCDSEWESCYSKQLPSFLSSIAQNKCARIVFTVPFKFLF